MTDQQIAKLIHKSDTLGTFIEVGAGQPVAHTLFNCEGASSTIYKAESPYDKSHQENLYGTSGMRSVSKEFVQSVIKTEMSKGHYVMNHNTYYASSFQVANKPEMLTHGWIGLRYRGVERYYHITLTGVRDEREIIISMLGAIGLRILYCQNDMAKLKEVFDKESAMYSCIDIIEDESGNPFIAETISNLESGLEKTVCVSKEGKLVRLEDLSRAGDLVLMKGSFNPVHNHHVEIMEATMKFYPSGVPCYAISLDTFGKDHLEVSSLVERIKMINKLGYNVILFKKAYFNSNVSYLREQRFYTKQLIFPLGGDTVNRLIQSTYNSFAQEEGKDSNKNILAFHAHFQKVVFPYTNRKDIPVTTLATMVPHFVNIGTEESALSSTSVRDLYASYQFEAIKLLVPTEIYNDIIEYLKLTTKTI